MEEQIAELTARLTEIETAAGVTNTMFAEAYYYLTLPLMVLIHAGFLAYEMGASRMKNVLSSGVKNILACFSLLLYKFKKADVFDSVDVDSYVLSQAFSPGLKNSFCNVYVF